MEKIKLNIGSYNIANGGYAGHDMQLLADDILSKELDVVGLQEVDIGTGRVGGVDTLAVLSDLTGYKYYAFFKTIDFWGGDYGVAILSKYPITETVRREIDSEIHEQRVLGQVKIDLGGKTLNFFVTHLSWEDDELRVHQFEFLNSVINEQENFILTGDFNCNSLEEFDVLENAAWVNTVDEPIVTCGKHECIDNIVYSVKNITCGKAETLDNGHSDHKMLYATCEIS
ncbi:MAG: hypothetical protein E7627_07720 [Ruminococcaceae bacterium]|nr:hypothetical protein [Oscillospiraceae bacterium]